MSNDLPLKTRCFQLSLFVLSSCCIAIVSSITFYLVHVEAAELNAVAAAADKHPRGLIIPEHVREYWQTQHRPLLRYTLGDLPASIDWTSNDSRVKKQGECGACWAFAAVALIENLGDKKDLSEQVLISCVPGNDCDSGWYGDALKYIRDNGIPPEECYKYIEANGNCNDKCDIPAFVEKVQDYDDPSLWGLPAASTVNDLKALLQTGPVLVGMLVPDDGSFDRYWWGIYDYNGGPISHENGHAVLVVGYDDTAQYFKAKNSWGIWWGENGYFRIAYDDVTDDVQFAQFACTASGVYTVLSPTLSVTPPFHYAIAESGTTTFSVGNTGIGILNWTAAVNDPWLTVTGGAFGANSGTITVSYDANSADARIGTITVTATDAWNSPQTVEVRQAAESAIGEVKIAATDGERREYFGTSVSISGDYAIVGASGDDDNGYDSGSAYIFSREGEGWTQQAKLTALDGMAGACFGGAVSICGDYAIVGAKGHNANGVNSGSAYVFKREGASWTQQAELTPGDGAERQEFGCSVSISGDCAIVGAHLDDGNGVNSGSAYVFSREGESWTQQVKLTPGDGTEGEYFGNSVSIWSNYAIVAAHGGGSAYVFKREGASWTQQAKLTSGQEAGYDSFGGSASISGDFAIVGAHLDDANGLDSGSAYVFKREGESWTQQAKLTAVEGMTGARFGSVVSICGDYAIVGAIK